VSDAQSIPGSSGGTGSATDWPTLLSFKPMLAFELSQCELLSSELLSITFTAILHVCNLLTHTVTIFIALLTP